MNTYTKGAVALLTMAGIIAGTSVAYAAQGREGESRGRAAEAVLGLEDVRGNGDENEVRGRAAEAALGLEDVRGNGYETEIRGRAAEVIAGIEHPATSTTLPDGTIISAPAGMEVEVEHGVVTFKPHGGVDATVPVSVAGVVADVSNIVAPQGMEMEVEHGVVTFKPHGGDGVEDSGTNQNRGGRGR